MSVDTLLVRMAGVDGWNVVFWRGVFIFSALFLAVLARKRLGLGRGLRQSILDSGPPVLLTGFISGTSTFLFPMAVMNTNAANALVILSAAPLFAAVLGRLWFNEGTAPRTWIAIIFVMAGIVLVFSGSIGGGSIRGDGIAVLASFFLSATMVSLRRYPGVSRGLSVMLGGLVAVLWAASFATPFTLPQQSYWILLLLGGVVMPLALTLIAVGTRFISAAEAGLLLILETVLGILWVYLVFGEIPSRFTFLGGMIVLLTLFTNSFLAVREEKAA